MMNYNFGSIIENVLIMSFFIKYVKISINSRIKCVFKILYLNLRVLMFYGIVLTNNNIKIIFFHRSFIR